ncbi:MAG: hypothetical protein JWM87_715 [Candidatus Eremiobacteraeota bacterium]|nr:hypothetical protein [Candidatus Eremiobacteraeota bacterium]
MTDRIVFIDDEPLGASRMPDRIDGCSVPYGQFVADWNGENEPDADDVERLRDED